MNMHALRVLVAMAMASVSLVEAGKCCAVCLADLGPSNYDVTSFTECDAPAAKASGPGCCFDCPQDTTISLPSVQSTQVAGKFQTVSWTDSNLAKVTYVTVTGPLTAAHPRPTALTTQAEKDSKGNYLFCLDNPGTIIIRGFGAAPSGTACQKMSPEIKITVTAGEKGASCSKKPSPGNASGSGSGSSGNSTKPKPPSCNPQRGFITSDNVCECTSDYSGPPECNGLSTWKLLVSIAGGVAALFSIIISVRQFMLFRKRKEEERNLATQQTRHSKDEVEVMAISAAPDYYDAKRTPPHSQASTFPDRTPPHQQAHVPMKPYPVDSHHNMSPRQSREYTL